MAKIEKTFRRVGTIASALLRNPKTSAKVKSVAASVLTQRPDRKKKKPTSKNTSARKKK